MKHKLASKLNLFLNRLVKDGSFINIVTIIVAILCFIPVYKYSSSSNANADQPIPSSNSTVMSEFNTTSSLVDDYYDNYYIVSFDQIPFFREATISTLIITLPSALDALLDMIPEVVVVFIFGEEYHSRVKNIDDPIFHLTLPEKLLYLVGVACLSTICFNPVLNYSATTSIYSATTTLYVCFQNASTVLLLCPVLSFLTRCCPTWTPIRTLVFVTIICTAAMLSSFVSLVDPTSQTAANMSFATNVLFCICSGLYFCMMVLSAVNTFWFHQPYPDGKQFRGSDSNSRLNRSAVSEERFRNIVIAAHMSTNFFDILLNTVWYFYSYKLTAYTLGIFVLCVVAFSVVIFVTEIRGRKHAAVVAMVSISLHVFILHNSLSPFFI
jgi:hypothetical protein